MPGCRQFDAPPSPARSPLPRVEMRRYVRRGARPPRAANDNRRSGAPAWYWVAAIGAMPTIGLIAILTALL